MNKELKTCPNCKKRIGIKDIMCPYCKYIDDPKYKKRNDKLIKNSKKKSKKINKGNTTFLLIPIISYLVYLIFDIHNYPFILLLILLNCIPFFIKKNWCLGIIFIEFIGVILKFIYNVTNKGDILNNIIIILLLIIFSTIPKVLYMLSKTKRKIKK